MQGMGASVTGAGLDYGMGTAGAYVRASSVSGRSVGSRRSLHSVKSEIPMVINAKTGRVLPLAVARARKESIDADAVPLESAFGMQARMATRSQHGGSVGAARSGIYSASGMPRGGPPSVDWRYSGSPDASWQQQRQQPGLSDDAVSVSRSTFTAVGRRAGRWRLQDQGLPRTHSHRDSQNG